MPFLFRPDALRRVALLVLMLGGAPAFAASSGPVDGVVRIELSPAQSTALGISTAPLGPREAVPVSGWAARVVVPPTQQRVVAAPLPGLLEQVTVTVNDPVRAGQPIGRLLSPMLAELQRGLVQGGVQARLADEAARRDQQLFDEGLIAEARLRATLAARTEAQAALAERRQAVRLAGVPEAMLARIEAGRASEPVIELRSPIDGVVLEQAVAVGSRVEAAAPLFQIARLRPLWLELQVPVDRLARVRVGDAVEVAGHPARGRVSALGRGAGSGQFVLVRAELTQNIDGLVPGQGVEVRVNPAAAPERGWRVPVSALVRHQGRAWVFVAVSEGIDAIAVRLLDEGETGALIDGPLAAEARLVVRGVAPLKARLVGVGGE